MALGYERAVGKPNMVLTITNSKIAFKVGLVKSSQSYDKRN